MKSSNLLAVISAMLLISAVLTGFPMAEETHMVSPGSSRETPVIIADDEGDGDYASIRDAVNNANQGSIIEVYSGDYYECNISISQPRVTLKGVPYELGNGNNSGKPWIHGQGLWDVIVVRADDVAIFGFAIENSGTSYAFDIIDIQSCNNSVITDNDISHYTMGGIVCGFSSNNRISGNTISHSAYRHGILLFESNSNHVTENIISDMNKEGICIWGSHYNTISGNKISGCKRFGIDLIGDYNTVVQNSFEGNKDAGLHINGGVHNVIKQNNFIDNDPNAFFTMLLPLRFPFYNQWVSNYWDDWSGVGPKVIYGSILYFIPWIEFDLFPAREPYEI